MAQPVCPFILAGHRVNDFGIGSSGQKGSPFVLGGTPRAFCLPTVHIGDAFGPKSLNAGPFQYGSLHSQLKFIEVVLVHFAASRGVWENFFDFQKNDIIIV